MGRLLPLLAIASLVLFVFALVDCITSNKNDVRALPKGLWIVIILLIALFGPIAWLVAGRPRSPGSGPGGGRSGRGPRRPLAPDDDPEFLDGLAQQRRDDEELLRQWEADMRRQEDDRRKPPGDDPTAAS
ncbi:MAG TPA: PLD nuclease N-terminal domain-containing protein [Micromonosporaceae bacterium]|nr:PLD nuclease N-terminal domain-containing protein [Micromonosporaceae bacterium]